MAQAEAEAVWHMLEVIRRAADKALPNTWQAAAWLLERRHPDVYGQRARVEVSRDIREEAALLAAELGLDPADVLAEAETILSRAFKPGRRP